MGSQLPNSAGGSDVTATSTSTWLLPVLAAAALMAFLTRPAFLVPDGPEMAAAGACVWRNAFDGPATVASACGDHELFLWPPLFPALAGLLALATGPIHAPLVVSMAAGVLVACGVAVLARRLAAGEVARVSAPVLACGALIALPLGRAQAVTGDARLLAVGLLLAAWLRLDTARGARDGVLVGLLAGAAALARPEALLGAGLVGIGALLWRRGALAGVAAGLTLMIGPWAALLSWAYGRPALLARAWESAVYPWADTLPVAFLVPLLGLGTGGTPLRDLLAQRAPTALSEAAATPAWPDALSDALPWTLLTLAACGVAARRAARTAEPPHADSAAGVPTGRSVAHLAPWALGLPALAISVLPQARLREIPAANLLPVAVAAAVLAGVGAAALARLLTAHLGRLRAHLVAGALVASLVLLPDAAPRGSADHDPAWDRAGAWLAANAPPEARIGASLHASSVVHRAGRLRAGLPSPWEVREWMAGSAAPEWLVTTEADATGAALVIADLSRAARWERAFSDTGASGPIQVWRRVPGEPGGPVTDVDALVERRVRTRAGGRCTDDALWPRIVSRARDAAGSPPTPPPLDARDPADDEARRLLATLSEAIGSDDEPTRLVALSFVVRHGLAGVLRFEPSGVRTSPRAAVSAVMARARTLDPAAARAFLRDGLSAEDAALVRISALELWRLGPAGDAGDPMIAGSLRDAAARVSGTADALLLEQIAAVFVP